MLQKASILQQKEPATFFPLNAVLKQSIDVNILQKHIYATILIVFKSSWG